MEPLLQSLPIDFRFEAALDFLPERGSPPSEVMFFGESVTAIDAWGGVAIRTAIDYYASYQQRRVTVSPPLDANAWRLLYSFLRSGHPAQLVLPFDAADPPRIARSVLLPAIPFAGVYQAEEAAGAVIDRASGRTVRGVRFAASALPEFVDNSLRWASTSPIPPVGCIIHERSEDEIQLVVADLGERIGRRSAPAEVLERAVADSPEGALATLARLAEARGLDASFTLASGVGRLYWRQGVWSRAQGEPVRGFVAAVSIPLD